MHPHHHNEAGVSMCRHTVFPGIDFIFLDVERETLQFHAQVPGRTFAINHCEDGRIECKFNSGEYLYMGAGDMSVGWHIHDAYHHKNFFPTKRFKGVVLLVDVDKAQPVLDDLIKDAPINLTDLANRFCERSEFGMLITESDEVRRVFSSLYDINPMIQHHYFRLKVLEIFLLLSVISTTTQEKKTSYRKQQVELVKKVKNYLLQHFATRITIDDLGDRFAMPTSTLKRCFKGVFGVTIHQFIKECRIDHAKQLLLQTDEPVLRIANVVGYENGSKFTATFKESTGMTPSEYRKKHMG